MTKIWEWLKSHPYIIGGLIAVSVTLYFLFRANANAASANAAASQSAADQAAYNAQSSGGNPLYGGGGFGASVPVTASNPPNVSSPSEVASASVADSAPVQSTSLLDNLISSGAIPASATGGFTTNAAGVQTPIPIGMNNNSDFTPHAVVSSTQAAPEVTEATTIKPLYQTPLTVGGSKTLL